ncbi:PREDICTED: F-box/kelch-repeat protein SKIP11-like [Camelina sativa]|uniref:F-box/kelch-repeat protein SKIP11-like n=1 Tax=Camelina sativa TaxID=90675 RepID=A0ABM0TE80_CAMSA|nr:PREDICTED: F-box/kelch-repeat protein SKIP11-like [Camelina sativa]XP_010425059.1 PREDICTED: F-box/kelch-repeat protein SKIP11-like [Camelina sativa]
MLEDRSPDSCLSSRVFSSSRLSESKWSKSYMYPDDDDVVSETKLVNGKRALEEVVGEIRHTKSLKLMGFSIKYDSDSSDYSLSGEEQADAVNGDGSSSRQEQEQSDSNENGGDSSDSHSLINEIGRDNSIDCLIRCSRSDYGSIASVNRNFRSLVKTGEIYGLRRQNGFVEHWVYFSCQLLEWVAFDPVERKWMQLPTMPSSVTFMCTDKESLAVGTDLLVLGKDDFSSHVIYRYSLLTNSWSSGMKMNSPRCLFGSASLGEIAIFAGGCDSQGKILDFAELYNSELQTWVTLPRMYKPRKMCSGVFMDGKFYVIGGIGGADSKVLTCGEEYDLETKKWTQVPDLSPPRSRADQADMSPAAEAPPLVAVVNDQLYAADHADMEVRKYDKETKKWFTIGRLPERAGSVNGWGLAFRACGERLIVIGGPKYSGGGFIELNSWIPSEGGPPHWTLLDRKHSPNFVYNCAVMGC